eukprot:CAMPEP_0119008588 /NCGR_PEP_ID=MMETSP1176-20130426/3805_1 /TAXON_ID=265551 /ORGANISM="Synedropsis recta cf, Strain CCMP1620" /LENGTH=428 /DNA_ID=CAMNT_0006960949 /DNA_START=124 /DNA_END=1410 /DNA_ORIENTATION=+
MSNNNEDKKAPLPTFSGMGMPMNVMINMDEEDVGEETTRRIGAPSFTPSFEPVAFDTHASFQNAHASSITTAPVKAAVAVAAAPAPAPASLSSNWKLTDATVLPEFHPLERTAIFVPNTSPSTVASRVATVLQERSIQADFSEDCQAKCLTEDNVDFRVFLYRGKKQYGHGIIVEVQRRSGNSLHFYNDIQAILDAAEGKAVSGGPPLKKKVKTTIPLVADDDDDNEDEVVSSSSLDFVAKMLSHTGHDAQYLALQTLSSLTDSNKMGKNTAGGVAKQLLTPGNEVGTKVFDMIVLDVSKQHQKQSKNGGEDDTDADDDDASTGIRLMAMTVLCNVVTAVKDGNVISDNMRALLRPVMLMELQKSETTPQMAYMTSKCLAPLLLSSYNGAMAKDNELYAALRGAIEVGKEKHAGLAEQAEACLQAMER